VTHSLYVVESTAVWRLGHPLFAAFGSDRVMRRTSCDASPAKQGSGQSCASYPRQKVWIDGSACPRWGELIRKQPFPARKERLPVTGFPARRELACRREAVANHIPAFTL